MKKFSRFLTIFFLTGGFISACLAYAQNDAPQNLIIVADWGIKGPSAEIINAVERYPSLRLAVVWPAGSEPSDRMKKLFRAGRIEPVMTLADEPVLPLLAGAWSSSMTVAAAWPEDVRDIIARNHETNLAAFGRRSSGVYLKSGAFSPEVIPLLSEMSVLWAVVPGRQHKGFYLSGRFHYLAPYEAGPAFSFPKWLASRREQNMALLFGSEHQLTAGQIDSLGQMQSMGGSPRTLLPGDLADAPPGLAIPYESLPFDDEDAEKWTRNPLVWERIMRARQALEEYKNSGQAKLRVVQLAREELYHLYRYDALSVVQSGSDPDEEQKFLAGIGNVYRLIGLPMPDQSAIATVAVSTSPAVDSTLQIESMPESVAFMVPSPENLTLAISKFTVSVTSETVTYAVEITSFSLSGDSRVDVYMDLNNLRAAGLTRLLPGAAGFLREQDAWEYALRFERNQVSLFRAGRYDAVISAKFPLFRQFEVSIPRAMLRGNPLYWGYQVITMERKDAAAPWRVNDFLAKDASSRARLFEQSPLQLPAFRIK